MCARLNKVDLHTHTQTVGTGDIPETDRGLCPEDRTDDTNYRLAWH